jgi:hypothetical protein
LLYVKEIGEAAINDVVASFNEILDDLKRIPNVDWLKLGGRVFDFVTAKILGRTPIGRAILIVGGDKKPTEIVGGIFDYLKTSVTNPLEAWKQANQLFSDATKAIGDIWNSIGTLISDSKNLQSKIENVQTEANLDKVAEVFVEFSVSQILDTAANLLTGKPKGSSAKWKTSLTRPVVLSPTKINLRHVFSGEIKKGKALGYHTAFSISEGGGVQAKISSVLNQSTQYPGVYRAKIELIDSKIGKRFNKSSTFFPDSWNRVKVTDEIRSAYQNALSKNGVAKDSGKWNGISASGYKIEGYFQNGTINTAYPLID